MSTTTSSTACTPTDRFSHALRIEPRSFWRSKGSRRPSRFSTWGSTSSMYSYVVYRRWHLRHPPPGPVDSPSPPPPAATTPSPRGAPDGHLIRGPPSPPPVPVIGETNP